MGTNYSLEEIPGELKEQAEEWRGKLVESVAEIDDDLLERYFEDPDSITKEENAYRYTPGNHRRNNCTVDVWFSIQK